MDTLKAGFGLGVTLVILALTSQSCGSNAPSVPQLAESNTAPISPEPVVTVTPSPLPGASPTPLPMVISVFNRGTQDSSLGSTYTVSAAMATTIPAVVLRTAGSTEENGIAVGIDFGSDVGQCYYSANTETPDVFTLTQCTNSMQAGTELNLSSSQIITVWSYAHVNSPDSTVELILQGKSQ